MSPGTPSTSAAAAVLPVAMQTPVAGSLRRKRLRTRTPPGVALPHDTPPAVQRVPLAAVGRPVVCPAGEVDQKKYNRMLCQLKYWHARKVEAATNEDGNQDRPQGVDFRRLSVEGKLALVREWLRDTSMGSQELKNWALTFYQSQRDIDTKKRSRYINARTVMLTYQGPWGVVPANSFAEPLAGMSVDSLVAELKQRTEVKLLWSDLQTAAQTLHDKFYLQAHAVALELCTTTFAVDQAVRLHGHLFLRKDGKLRVDKPDGLAFRGLLPHKCDSLQGIQRAKGSNAGMYYLQAPKIGVLWSGGSLSPFRDYMVQGE